MEQIEALQARTGVDFVPGIDQSRWKERLLRDSAALTVVLTQPELTKRMEEDLRGASGKVYRHSGLPENPEGPVLFYGEEGLLVCRNLPVPAVVTAIPRGYCAQALTGLWNGEGCVVYVPAGFDIAPYVPMTSKTRLNFSHLAALEKDCGAGIYDLSVEELYRAYPAYFVNIYGGAKTGIPAVPEQAVSLEDFDRQLEEKLAAFLGSFPGAQFTAAYFDENLERRPSATMLPKSNRASWSMPCG
jgi:hypothetical protein